MKKTILFSVLVLLFISVTTAPAGTKEELVRLQHDINTLRNQMLEFEKNLTENISGLKSLIEQLNDQVAQSNLLLDKAVTALEQKDSGENSNNDEIIATIRMQSGKIDEMSTSISALARQVSELKSQSKPLNRFVPSSPTSSDATFNEALNDLIAGNSDLAIQGFNAYLNFFPSGDKAAAARYYIGEAHYNMKRYPQAIEAFTRIIEENADSDKVASALFKRGKSSLETGKTDAAEADFKEVMKRFPESPEASLSKAELAAIGRLN